MSKRAYRWMWTARIEKGTLTALQELAASLGFVATAPGLYQGAPAPADLLDALATAYRLAPGGTRLALKGLLNGNGLLPSPPSEDDDADGAG